MPMQQRTITVVGAGITGLWQALTLARRGHRVRLIEQSAEPFARCRQRAMPAPCSAPYCETEAAAPVVRDLGLESHRRCGARPIPGTVARTARWWSPPPATAASSTASRA